MRNIIGSQTFWSSNLGIQNGLIEFQDRSKLSSWGISFRPMHSPQTRYVQQPGSQPVGLSFAWVSQH